MISWNQIPASKGTSSFKLGIVDSENRRNFSEIPVEATKQIPRDIKEKNTNLPWKEMARMRDKMIHGYFSIVHDILWETAKHDIPETKPMIEDLLEEIE